QSRQPGLEWQMLIKEIDVRPLSRINQSGCEQVQALVARPGALRGERQCDGGGCEDGEDGGFFGTSRRASGLRCQRIVALTVGPAGSAVKFTAQAADKRPE